MEIKVSYIGGGSKLWARVFMTDLALAKDLKGEIALYDIDVESAYRNKKIGEKINENPVTLSKFNYKVYENLGDTLKGATFVIISILPGTFEEMRSDVHAPEEYGIYQAVGDTTGPGGVLRSMRTVPLYEGFAEAIRRYCPDAWVINLTNPMSICTKTLYDVFPNIKAFGCCHEVFHAQDFLALVYSDICNDKRPNRKELYADASGVNHFTWITEARYKNVDLLALLPSFMEKYYERGYYEGKNKPWNDFLNNCFSYGNKVKMNMYKEYRALGAAGDRHLVEFFNNEIYLKNKEQVANWKYSLTTVDYRIMQQKEKIAETIAMANGTKEVEVVKSDEEVVDLMRAILGYETIVSNVNMPNKGQMPGFPLGDIVETNCVFSNGCVKPVVANELPDNVRELVLVHSNNINRLYEGIKKRDLNIIFESFRNQPLCHNLSLEQAKELFKKMCFNTRKYLNGFFDLEAFFQN